MKTRSSPYMLHSCSGLYAIAMRMLILGLLLEMVRGGEYEAPLYDFLTQPELHVPKLTIDAYEPENVAPGYIFMSPFSPEVRSGIDTVNYQYGGAIYDNYGELVYSAAQPGRQWGAMDFVVCEVNNIPHICRSHYSPPPIGQQNDIVNASYMVVRSTHPIGEHQGWHIERDMHEFIVRPSQFGPTALQSSHVRHKLEEPVNFEQCSLQLKWLKSSVMQEVKLDGSNDVIFEWGSDQLPLDQSVQCGGADGIFADGQSKAEAFDHFHMNSFDKDAQGDYYISSRHRSTIYKVSGDNSTIMWRLSRHISDFEHYTETDGNFDFAYQHHLRLQPQYPGYDLGSGKIVLSLFDNANDVYDYSTRTSNFSSGKVYLIDEHAMTATLKELWPLYHDRHELATNQGSFQLLPNGNRILGGGNIQEIIEWQPGNPNPVFRAHFGDWENSNGEIGHKINSYRNQRFEWKGYPPWKPVVFAFAANCGAPMSIYVSWNGATEVTSWLFYGSSTEDGPFEFLGEEPRKGFETRAEFQFTKYVYAIARDHEEVSLVVHVSVPLNSTTSRRYCGPARCEKGFDYATYAIQDCPATSTIADSVLNLNSPDYGDYHHCDPCF